MLSKPRFTRAVLVSLFLLSTVTLTSDLSVRAFVSAPTDKQPDHSAVETSTPTHAEVLARIKAEQAKAKQNNTETHEQAAKNTATHVENKQVHVENKARVDAIAEENKATHEANKVVHEKNKQKHEDNLERIEIIKSHPTPSTPIHKQPVTPTYPSRPEVTPQQPDNKPEVAPTQPETPTAEKTEDKLVLPEAPTGAGGEYSPEKKVLIRTGGF